MKWKSYLIYTYLCLRLCISNACIHVFILSVVIFGLHFLAANKTLQCICDVLFIYLLLLLLLLYYFAFGQNGIMHSPKYVSDCFSRG